MKRNILLSLFGEAKPAITSFLVKFIFSLKFYTSEGSMQVYKRVTWEFLAKPKCNLSDKVGMKIATCAFYLCVSCQEVLVLILYFSVKKGVAHESAKTNVHMKARICEKFPLGRNFERQRTSRDMFRTALNYMHAEFNNRHILSPRPSCKRSAFDNIR